MSELVSRLREQLAFDDVFTDDQILEQTKGTLFRASIEIGIAKEQLVKAMANHLPVFDKQFGKIRIRRNNPNF